GDNTIVGKNTPVAVSGTGPGGNVVIAIAAGQYHSLAVTSSGGALAWGQNSWGQLGDGTSTQRPVPFQVTVVGGAPLTGVAAVAGGSDHSLALKSDGTVMAWGYNYPNGQIGDGTTTQRLNAVAVSNLSGVSRIAAGTSFSAALRMSGQSSGTLWSWGANNFGQLGDGSTAIRTSAERVA